MPVIASTFIKGIFIGIANIIPGVSGGTMALVLGIYERLIAALHNMGPTTVKRLLPALTFKKEAREAALVELKRIDFWFLAWLGAGAVFAILATAKLITYLLDQQHDPTYGFFCGLILVSIAVPFQMMKGKINAACIISMLVATGLALTLAMSMVGPGQAEKARKKALIKGELVIEDKAQAVTDAIGLDVQIEEADFSITKMLWMFVCGVIAISAMILPGVSGSFMLLVMGVYFDVLAAIEQVTSFDFDKAWFAAACQVGSLMLGCGIGLLVFTRILNYVLNRWHDPTMTFLVGLMIGSLYGLWPFREFEMVAGEKIYTSLRLPEMGANFAITLVAFLVGCAIIVAFLKIEAKKEKK